MSSVAGCRGAVALHALGPRVLSLSLPVPLAAVCGTMTCLRQLSLWHVGLQGALKAACSLACMLTQ